MQEKLIFILSPPRSGSTLLQRMLGSHPDIFTHPEPHIITPLAYLGYYDIVDKAPYDHINAAEAIRQFVDNLPSKEEDYLNAVRAYTNILYARMLSNSTARMFLDKTPAYALVLNFLTKLYPNAYYIVLTRHPFAVMSSYANSFFYGDWQEANHYNPIINRYIPAIAQFLREPATNTRHIKYETLVTDPEKELEQIFYFLNLPNVPEAANYEKKNTFTKGMGDPISVNEHTRPTAHFVDKWVNELVNDREKLAFAKSIVNRIDPNDLNQWGYTLEQLLHPLDQDDKSTQVRSFKRPKMNQYILMRRIMLALRKDIKTRPHGKIIGRIRYYCDVLLRDQL